MTPRIYTALPFRLWLSQIAVIICTATHDLAQGSGIEWLTISLAVVNTVAVAVMLALTIVDRNRIWAVCVRFKKPQSQDEGGSK